MSAVTSSPNARDTQQSNPSAFTNPLFNDPYLPSSSNPEDLLQPSDAGLRPTAAAQPSHHSGYSSTGHISHANPQRNPNSPPDSFLLHQQTSNPDSSYLTDVSPYTNPNLSTSPPTGTDFLSPLDYTSEILSSEYSEHATPGFGDELFLTAAFSSYTDIGSGPNNIYSDDIPGDLFNDQANQFKPTTSTDTKPSAATVAPSQLLSPVLTNTPSPSADYRNLHVGAAPLNGSNQVSSHPTDAAQRRTRADIPPRALQHTPTLTGSSSSSLEPQMEPIVRAASPIVRVSSYSRGDSPTRSGGVVRSSSRRSRTSQASAHLSPARADDSSDEEVVEQPSNQRFGSLPIPEGLRAHDGSWIPNAVSGQAGIDPDTRAQMGNVMVPSLKQMEEEQQLKEKNEKIEEWIDKSDAGSAAGEDPNAPDRSRKAMRDNVRRRARSMGEPIQTGSVGLGINEPIFDDSNIPGPGALIDEESGEEDDDESETSQPESPPADVDTNTPIDEEPLPRQFYRPRPWHDVLGDTELQDAKMQPATSNAAMMRFNQRADNIETASRSATWGTRRLSETDVNKVIGSEGLLKNLSLNRGKDRNRPERIPSFLKQAEQAASRLIPKRSNSNMKRKLTEASQQNSSNESVEKPKRDSFASLVSPKRTLSFGRASRSPPLDTGSALAAMTTSIAAIGASGSMTPTSAVPQAGPWTQAKEVIRRNRSRSELPRSKPSASPGLAELMTQHGGPPMPTLASPLQEKPAPRSVPPPKQRDEEEEDDDEDDEDDNMEDKGVTMDLKVKTDTITPNFEGFKTHVRKLNPRLQHFLVDRVGTEQLRRYKKLVEFKVKHVHTINTGKCGSGKHCFAQGGEATILPPRTSAKDPEMTYAGFQVSGTGSDDDSSAFAEGTVTAALFPIGVPLPPVKRLPAEFECPLCFKVKKFQKPSDWTKHVHEDVQPFTCTFPSCAEPKSFKRKADWVRHENERHRQLEWWTCNMPDCSHTCYRKDNFVQHLVREHKKVEPKLKTQKTPRNSGSSKARGKTQAEFIEEWKASLPNAAADEVAKVWRLVDECHHDTKKQPKDEACKFCGNVCSSWKKLTVHLAKHMEQIAMPVLELVRQREVDPDTIISPVERPSQQRFQSSASPDTPTAQMKVEPTSVSPYSAASAQIMHHTVEDVTVYNTQQHYFGTPPPHGLQDYSPAFPDQIRPPSYGSNPYDMTGFPFPQPQQQQPQQQFVAINSTAPTTYPPLYRPSQPPRSSQPGSFRAPVGSQGFGVQGPVYGSPIEGMGYIYPSGTGQAPTSMRYDVPFTQAGDPNAGPEFQGQEPGQGGGGYGYQQ